MSTREILVEARSLIEDPNNWSPGTENRQCFCSATAIWYAVASNDDAFNAFSREAKAAGRILARVAGIPVKDVWVEDDVWGSIYKWNDNSTHADVMAAFGRAIEAAV